MSNAIRILIVEDDDGVRDCLHAWFENINHHPTCTASCADEAFEWLKHENFDVVITGINQPGMDGLKMTKIIRQQGGPPVIILTGHYTQQHYHEAYEVGASAFLCKPTSYENLLRIVELIVEDDRLFIGANVHEVNQWESF